MDVLPVFLILFMVSLILFLAVLIALFLYFRKSQVNISDISTILQNLNQSVQGGQIQIAAVIEKISHIEPVVQQVSSVQAELKFLAERVVKVEQSQVTVDQSIKSLENGLTRTEAAITSKVGDVQQQSNQSLHVVRNDLLDKIAKIQQNLTELQSGMNARYEVDQRTAESIRRLEAVIAGTQSKGSAGENILDSIFANLPAEWQVRNFEVNGKRVEFGLKLPNDLILPIDSKFAATELIEKFINGEGHEEKQKLKTQIEESVVKRAGEVKKYINPGTTTTFCVAVVPDAVYDLSSSVHTRVINEGVVLVSYSMFVPYLLLVFHTTLKTRQSIDLQRIDSYVQSFQKSIRDLQEELDGRFSKAITMLSNSKSDMQAHISKANSSLTGLQIGVARAESVSELSDSTNA